MKLRPHEDLGVLPLQDHAPDNPDPDLRMMVLGGRLGRVDPTTGEPRIAGGPTGEGTVGDVHPFRFWHQASREMGAWSPVFASVSLGSKGGSSQGDAAGSADGTGGASVGTGQPGTVGAHGRSLGRTSVGFPGGGRFGILGPGGAVRPGMRQGGGTVTAGDGGEMEALPLWSAQAADGRFAAAGHAMPSCWPLFPKGHAGLALAGTDERQQRAIWLPADPRMYAPHAGGPPEMGSLVYDLQPDRTPNGGRGARLQSAWRVLLLPRGLTFLAEGPALGLNFAASTLDRVGGFGLAIAPGDRSRGTTTPTPAAPGDPGRQPAITPGSGAAGSSGASGAAGAQPGPSGGAGAAGAGGPSSPEGPVTGSGAGQMPYNGGSRSDPETGAEPQGYTWDPGIGAWRGPVTHHPVPGGGIVGVLPGRGGGSGGRSSGPGICSDADPESLRDSFNVAFFMSRPQAFGPIHPGHVEDKHQHGTTFDGQPVNAGHIHHEAYYYQDRDRDAPLLFSRLNYPNPDRLPGIARVWLTYDARMSHDFAAGAREGMWRWYAEVPDFISRPGEPGDPTPTPTPTPTPEPLPEPNDPFPGKRAVTPPGGPIAPLPGDRGSHPAPGADEGGITVPGGRPCGGGGSPTLLGAPARSAFGHGGFFPFMAPRPGSRRSRLGVGDQDGLTPSSDPVFLASALVGPADRRSGVQELTLMRTMASGFASLHFRPQSLAPLTVDLRFTNQATQEEIEADDKLRPTVARLEPFAAGQKDAAGWLYNVKPKDSRFVGGEAAGGVVFLPPYVDIADYDLGLDLTAEGQPSDLAFFAFGPNTATAWGLPDLATGAMQTNSWRVKRNAPTSTTGSLAFAYFDGSTWTDIFTLSYDGNGLGAGVSGTAFLKLPTGTTAQRPATPATGMVRHNSTTGGIEAYYGGAWNALGAGTGRLVKVTVYSTAGSGTHTWDTAATSAIVVGIGGGGGGGGVAGTTAGQSACAGGGGAGGMFVHRYSTLSGADAAYTVGAGGAGGAAGGAAGTAGGDTTFDDTGTTLTAKGGGGGSFIAESAATGAAAGGSNVLATGSPNITAGAGNPGATGFKLGAAVAVGGIGGCSHLGGAGGMGGVNDAAGVAGIGPGAGGGGASSTNASGNDYAGGDGKDGMIVVYEYS